MKNEKVIITDVTGRDGFQMEDEWIETEDKVAILNKIIDAGIKRIEATSFVSPKAVPQLKDAREVIKHINREQVDLVVLIPNIKGAEFALEAGVDEVNVVVSVSETHNQKNVRKSVNESIDGIGEIYRLLDKLNIKVNVGLATTFGCPFEGIYDVSRVSVVIDKLKEQGLNRFMLSDTTGVANPTQITSFINDLTGKFSDSHFSLHLHNTRGMGLANLLAGYQAGICNFDAALGGIGGCPFAPGATGNVCLEDVVHMFYQMGVDIDPNVSKLIDASKHLEKVLGYKLPGQVMNAGLSTDTVSA
ncbi:hydroxymethylglutaryl-CoA lyase [Ornithinibacillus sp. L9]|uniref:Hydroxymethylglutaryl-CoA lyase n=1 Tax=Ornithinibacillus caprae TaxID=2678566 RepID=A0A6N8FD93_9BACI|nr:hydroxymethylglutaryl-CoA lyase [Ornithinibacillus caprae]MUK87642.1 hydroxymethylglutaryl-CoA lyase [Ornithinibacillus caprae]